MKQICLFLLILISASPFYAQTPVALSIVSATVRSQDGTAANGEIAVTVAGGTPPYQYAWNIPGHAGNKIDQLLPGNYSVTITDAGRDTAIQSYTVGGSLKYTASIILLEKQPLARLKASASGGLPPYAYHWSNGTKDSVLAAAGSGSYSVTITDQRGQEAHADMYLSGIYAKAIITHKKSAHELGSICLNIEGGKPPYKIAWSDKKDDNKYLRIGLDTGMYSVEITDAADKHTYINAEVCAPLQVNFNLKDGSLLSAVASGGKGPYKYTWSNQQNTSVIPIKIKERYTVHVEDANGTTIIAEYRSCSIAGYIFWGEPETDKAAMIWAVPVQGVSPELSWIDDKNRAGEDIECASNAQDGSFSLIVPSGTYVLRYARLRGDGEKQHYLGSSSGKAFVLDLTENCEITDLKKIPSGDK